MNWQFLVVYQIQDMIQSLLHWGKKTFEMRFELDKYDEHQLNPQNAFFFEIFI